MKDPIQYMWIMWCACAILTSCFCSHGNISECRSYKYITHLHVSLRMHASETPNTTSNIRRWFGQMADPANDLSCTLDLDFIGPSRAVHGSGRVGFWPNPKSTRRRRVEGRSNPKPTAGKIGRFGFLWWLASVRSDRLPKLKKASKSEKSVAGIWNFRRKLEILAKT